MTLTEIVEAMSKVCVVVIGDAIQDQYIFCRSERLCPEAPVPVLLPERIEERPGGAMNVVEQLRALGAHGKGVYGVPISVKRRFMVGHQMMMRVDEDVQSMTKFETMVDGLSKKVFGEDKIDAIVLSDYAKGTLTPELCQWVIKFANDNGIPVIVDPKGADWSKYAGANWVCPNEREAEALSCNSWHTNILRKLGSKGLALSYLTGGQVLIPACAKRVFDVTGAGDTVVAVFAAALAAGTPPVQAAELANIAAGWAVGEVGTTVCSKETLLVLVK
jgi:bifunctional ADP-heptose synthase (sugar kinase/adenylyltransferase)